MECLSVRICIKMNIHGLFGRTDFNALNFIQSEIFNPNGWQFMIIWRDNVLLDIFTCMKENYDKHYYVKINPILLLK